MIMYFFFQLVHMVDHIESFSYTEPSLKLWDEAHLFRVDDLFDVFMGFPCTYFVEYFYISVHEKNWFVVLFICWIFTCFGYQGDC